MTVIRSCISCATCGFIHTLRIGIGSEKYQLFYFDCNGCCLPITIALRKDIKNENDSSFSTVEAIENCVIKNSEGTIINLHPNFGINKNHIHQDNYFASQEYLPKIVPYIKKRVGTNLPQIETKLGIKTIIDAAYLFDFPNVANIWNTIKNIISIKDVSSSVSNKLIKQYYAQRNKYEQVQVFKSYKEILVDYFSRAFYPKFDELYYPCIHVLRNVEQTYSSNFMEFKDYYNKELKTENIQRCITTFSDYYRHYVNYSQILTNSRISDYNIDEIILSSKNFDHVNKYYAQAYEALTSNYTVFACVCNLISSRKYNIFKTMNLEKYLQIEKINRINTFMSIAEFEKCTHFLDNKLRNGISHASIRHENERLIYKSGNKDKLYEIPYTRYILMCNELTINLAVLFCFEIYLAE